MLIRNKLILLFTLLTMGVLGLLSTFLYSTFSLYRQVIFRTRLTEKAETAAGLLINRRHQFDDFFNQLMRSDMLTIVDEHIMIFDEKGVLVYTNRRGDASPAVKAHLPKLTGKHPLYFQVGENEAVGILHADSSKVFHVVAMGYDQVGFTRLIMLKQLLLWGNLGSMILLVVVGYFFASRVLKPISKAMDEVDTISAQHLDRRLDEGNRRDEIARLAMTFNQMLNRLEKSFEAQRSFVSHASHELRTPLTNLLGTLQISHDYDQDTGELKQSIRSAMDEIRQLISLTNSLLSLARTGEGLVGLELISVDDCITNALSHLYNKYPGRQIRYEFGILPENSDHFFEIQGNSTLLTTCILNVVDNACKYSDGPVEIVLSQETEHSLSLTIRDQGQGIAQQDLPHLLEPFFRSNEVSHVTGFGIGLAVVQKILTLHGGSIEFQSEVGQGTTVIMRLPLAGEGS
ncbi:HAMP domain-containing sensor histidine kinase [Siphonobacter aquaeclarae]|uniref:histidine kinase n=1 Tax=Siphonobacter aquaeclarae TaxID=563176 RepID=A0A1G9QDP7_9BACT|nr:HAMP domain-containing sensor histidine kinase [Siphonobacter aquaeclarae]SDM09106.1 Signal transduction histidine kinase [Siphonobacter aquaeclarae]